MQTLVLKIEYDGTNYGGWQIQPNAPTIQEKLENVIEKIANTHLGVIGSGRTDAGVHARGQVAHIKLTDRFPVPIKKIPVALNTYLPKDIRVTAAQIMDSAFNARFDAIEREYSYTLSNKESVFSRNFVSYFKYPFNPEILNEAASIFVGKHDFTTFSKFNPATGSYKCNVRFCRWSQVCEHQWRLTIAADRFVYGMVRALTGAMLDAARGKRSIDELMTALDCCDRVLSSPLAPPQGLILERVSYPPELKIFA